MCSVSTANAHSSTDPDLSLLTKIASSLQTSAALSVYDFTGAAFGLYFSMSSSPWSVVSHLGEHIPNSGQLVAKGYLIRQSLLVCLAWEGRARSGKGEAAAGLCLQEPAGPHCSPSLEMAAVAKGEEKAKHCSSLTFQSHPRSLKHGSPTG